MGIPARKGLLGSIFLFPPDPQGAEVLPGSNRDRRGRPGDWSRWVTMDIADLRAGDR